MVQVAEQGASYSSYRPTVAYGLNRLMSITLQFLSRFKTLYTNMFYLLSSNAARCSSLNHDLWIWAALNCFLKALNRACTPTHPIRVLLI